MKVTKTVPKYIGGASYIAYSTDKNWEGKDQNDESCLYDDANPEHEIACGKKYYVVVDDDGNPVKDGSGDYQVTEEKTSMPLDMNCDFLKDLPYDSKIWAYLLDETTLDEQINTHGSLGWSTPEIASVNKAREDVVDGPGESGNGNNSYGVNTWFTSAVVNASTWNPYLIYKLGVAYAHQSIKNGLSGAYAPAMNTHRTPFGGRNFEYYSEDGFIGGSIGAAEVEGLQSNGIYVFVKHMAMNDNDTNRDGNITWVSEQAAREIYLKDYEICVKKRFVPDDENETGTYENGEGVLGIMTSLNRDGISMFHTGLYQNIVRGEWGYHGLMITDGVGPYTWVMTPGSSLYAGIGQLGGSLVTTYYSYEGDASTTNYGRYLLRLTTKNLLYQVAHTGKLLRGEHTTLTVSQFTGWRLIRLILDVVLIALMALCAAFMIVKPVVTSRKQGKEGNVRHEKNSISAGSSRGLAPSSSRQAPSW